MDNEVDFLYVDGLKGLNSKIVSAPGNKFHLLNKCAPGTFDRTAVRHFYPLVSQSGYASVP